MSHRSFARRFFRTPVVVVTFVLIAAACSPMAAGATGNENWSREFYRQYDLDGGVLASTMFEGQLIVGGYFTSNGGTALHGVARWSGTGWRPLDAGIPSGTVRSLAVYQGALYANGWRWDGEVWTNALVVDGQVDCLAVHDGLLVAGGLFTSARGVPADNLLAWDGVDVAELGGGCNNRVQALASDGARLYAGGSFTQAGDVAAPRIACWDGTSWSDLAGGISGDLFWCCVDNYESYTYRASVNALAVADDGLYVGGQFQLAGGDSISALARWDGAAWHEPEGLALGGVGVWYSGNAYQYFPPDIFALTTDPSGGLIAGGRFKVQGQHHYGLVRHDIAGWSVVGGGFTPYWIDDAPSIHTLLPTQTDLIVGGWFPQIGDIDAVNAARWDGSGWSPLVHEHGLGTDGYVFTSLEYRGDLVFAGGFENAGGLPAGCLAAFHDDHWENIGLHGVAGSWPRIRDMVEFEEDLVVAGMFTSADGVPALNVARWDGVSWQAMGAGLPCTEVAALCVHQGRLYAAGGDLLFPSPPQDIEATRLNQGFVYRWDGAAWEQIIVTDEYLEGAVSDLASYGGELVVAGSFTTANDQPMRGLLAWNGTACREFGGGVQYWARCLLAVADDLYVGGRLIEAGDLTVNNLARWDGAAWHDVAGGVRGFMSNYGVFTLAEAGGRLCVGGRFYMADDVPADNVAILDHGAWSALGSGAGPTVTTLAWRHGDLYVGGAINMAGSQIVGGISCWDGLAVPVAVSEFRGRRDGLAVELTWAASLGLSGGSFRVWRDDAAGVPQPLEAGPVAEGTAYLCRDTAAPAGATLYRLQWRRADGATEWLAEATVGAAELPLAARFAGVHPNPFNPRVTAAFVVGAPQRVRIAVADARGREVALLADRQCEAGRHEVVWEGRDGAGRALPAGVYFLSLRGDDGRDTVKVVLVR